MTRKSVEKRNEITPALSKLSLAIGALIVALPFNAPKAAVNIGLDSTGAGTGATTTFAALTGSGNNICIGENAGASLSGSYNLISGHRAGFSLSGESNQVSGDHAGHKLSGSHNLVSGLNAGMSLSGDSNLAFGLRANDDPGTVVSNTIAIGTDTHINKDDGVAIGKGSSVTSENSAAIGANSVANEDDTVSVGSVGAERRITNVAPAINGTDAVNLNQLTVVSDQVDEHTDDIAENKVDIAQNKSDIVVNRNNISRNYQLIKNNTQNIETNRQNIEALSQGLSALDTEFREFQTDTRRGIAGAMAAASIPTASVPGGGFTGFGVGTFQGEQSVAVGMSKWLTPTLKKGKQLNVIIQGTATHSGSGTGMYGFGGGILW